MSKNAIVPGRICGDDVLKVKEAVCINIDKVYDSCKEKDCIEDAPVFFKADDNCEEAELKKIINNAINVKIRRAEVVDVFTDIEEVPFKRGFFTVDIRYFIVVTLDFFVPKTNCAPKIVTVKGLVNFDKKVILFGSEGNVKMFKSHFTDRGVDCMDNRLEQDNLPMSKVEVAEPIALSAKVVEEQDCGCCCCCDKLSNEILSTIRPLDSNDTCEIDEDNYSDKKVVVSIGIFSIIKLLRNVQLMIPAFDFCMPNKECVSAAEESPCDLFDTIEFPADEFFPPQKFEFPGLEEAVE
jgi:hypothetical protein